MSFISDYCQPFWLRWLPLLPQLGCGLLGLCFLHSSPSELTRSSTLAWCSLEPCLSGEMGYVPEPHFSGINAARRGTNWECVFPWYALSFQQHNWPIAKCHLEYLGQLSTCNCEDLELVCYFWFSLIVLPRNSYFQTSQIRLEEIYGRCDAFLHPLGKHQTTFTFSFSGKTQPSFPSNTLFLNLGGYGNNNTSLRELLWRFKKASALFKFYAGFSICMFSKVFHACYACILCMFLCTFYACFFKPFYEVLGAKGNINQYQLSVFLRRSRLWEA